MTDRRKIQDWLKAKREWETCEGHHKWEPGMVIVGVTKCQRCGRVSGAKDFKRVATGEGGGSG